MTVIATSTSATPTATTAVPACGTSRGPDGGAASAAIRTRTTGRDLAGTRAIPTMTAITMAGGPEMAPTACTGDRNRTPLRGAQTGGLRRRQIAGVMLAQVVEQPKPIRLLRHRVKISTVLVSLERSHFSSRAAADTSSQHQWRLPHILHRRPTGPTARTVGGPAVLRQLPLPPRVIRLRNRCRPPPRIRRLPSQRLIWATPMRCRPFHLRVPQRRSRMPVLRQPAIRPLRFVAPRPTSRIRARMTMANTQCPVRIPSWASIRLSHKRRRCRSHLQHPSRRQRPTRAGNTRRLRHPALHIIPLVEREALRRGSLRIRRATSRFSPRARLRAMLPMRRLSPVHHHRRRRRAFCRQTRQMPTSLIYHLRRRMLRHCPARNHRLPALSRLQPASHSILRPASQVVGHKINTLASGPGSCMVPKQHPLYNAPSSLSRQTEGSASNGFPPSEDPGGLNAAQQHRHRPSRIQILRSRRPRRARLRSVRPAPRHPLSRICSLLQMTMAARRH